MPANLENSAVATGLEKKGNAKECSNYHTIALISHAGKVMLKILQARLQPYVSHEIKRCLLLGRKVMTNPGNILKSRDISLPTKVHLVKAMVFPVVMYGCTEGNGNPLQYSCLENPIDREAW